MSWIECISPFAHHAGHRRFGNGVINNWRVIGDHEIFLFEEGAGSLTISGRDYPCPENSFIIIPFGQRHISFCETESIYLHWIHFDWVAVPGDHPPVVMEPAQPDPALYHPAPDFVPEAVFHGKIRDPMVYTLSRMLHQKVYSASQVERMTARAVLLEILVRLLVREETVIRTSDPHCDAEEMRIRLTEFANQPVGRMPPMDAVLSEGGKSYSRQERLFKKEFGISPHQYITRLRVERICQALMLRPDPVPVIAEEFGFKDLAYFSRYVKKHTGKSPRALRAAGSKSGLIGRAE